MDKKKNTKQPDAKFHHEEAHQQMPEAMNLRCSVTMATRPKTKTITKVGISLTGRKTVKP